MRLRSAAVIVLLFLFGVIAFSQRPGRPGAPEPAASPMPMPSNPSGTSGQQQTTVIRTTTRLVEVTVVVQDKQGNPITGLKADDFVLKDEGKQQKISAFTAEDTHTVAASKSPEPNTFVNRPAQRPGTMAGATVVLIDILNSRLIDQQRVRENVLRFLKQTSPRDPVALYSLDNKLHVLQEFTTDPSSLIAALGRYSANTAARVEDFRPEQPVSVSEELEYYIQTMNSMNQRIADVQVEARAERTAQALTDVAHHLAGIGGRKNLLWVSTGFPITIGGINMGPVDPSFNPRVQRDLLHFVPEAANATRALADANVAVYPVDSRGPLGVWDIATETNRPNADLEHERPIESTGATERDNNQRSQDTMISMALATGGRPFNKYDLADAVRRALDDAHASYTIGYYPNHGKWDGKFHRIALEVKRPETRVLHRPGYYATSTPALDKTQREQLLYDTATSPLDATRLSVTAHAALSESGGKKSLELQLRFDPREITFNAVGDETVGALDLLLVEEAANGKLLVSKKGTLDLNIKTEPGGKEQKLFGYKQMLELMPGADHVRIVAVDTQSGAAGSLTIPVSKIVATP